MAEISVDVARRSALDLIRSVAAECDPLIIDDMTSVEDFGWVFHWNSRLSVEGGDQAGSFIGAAPVVVNRITGETSFSSSAPAVHRNYLLELRGWFRRQYPTEKTLFEKRMDETQHVVLTPEELTVACQQARVQPQPYSPVSGLQAGDPGRVVPRLIAKGILLPSGTPLPAWQAALSTLASPKYLLSWYLCGKGQWQASDVYVSSWDGVSCTSTDDGFLVTTGFTPALMLDLATEGLGLDDVREEDLPSQDISVEEFSAIAALVDASRSEAMQAQLERRPPNATFSPASLVRMLDAATEGDVRWFGGLVASVAPPTHSLSSAGIAPGLEQLAARNWVTLGDTVTVQPDLTNLCTALGTPTAYISLAGGAHGRLESRMVLVRAVVGVWVIEYWHDAARGPLVRLLGLGGLTAQAFLKTYFMTIEAWRPTAPTTVMADQLPPDQRTRFATPPAISTSPPPSPWSTPSPPTPAPPRVATCANPSCGKPLKPGKNFCAACGTPVA